MKERAPSRSSKAYLYRDFRREVNILDFSRGMSPREIRLRRRKKIRRTLLRLLLLAGCIVLWNLLGR